MKNIVIKDTVSNRLSNRDVTKAVKEVKTKGIKIGTIGKLSNRLSFIISKTAIIIF